MKITHVFILISSIVLLSSCTNDEAVNNLSSFSLNYPSNNEQEIVPGFQFRWEKSTNATRYELYIGNTSETNDIVLTDITDTLKTVNDLRYGKTYFWRVVALDNQGNSRSSSTSTFETKRNYTVMDASFYIPQLDRSRKISIYLPPNYNNESISYPVLYMHDGQAIFAAENDTLDEWEVDDTLDRLYQEIGFNLIVVGIDNNQQGNERTNEYSPWISTGNIIPSTAGLGGLGDEYVEFIVKTLKPYIDTTYRTLSDKKHTGIMGSSMGGLISCYAGLKYPDVFGKMGVYSPSFWFSEGGAYELANTNSKLVGDSKFYFLAGDSEATIIDFPKDVQKMIDIFIKNGISQDHIAKNIVVGGTHEVYLWRDGFEETIKWLFID
ncbi:alpha/beta hydrolase [Aquimarina longa]|uniref:alpha/beta hydrolase n=1 Tax=Aquimarina longa TaxID=1080221 RepID=UPI000783034E|nr:alpha/beta hydrolase-fold protein [Aquimarina longa]